jgi:carboxymethylenebutenolidase
MALDLYRGRVTENPSEARRLKRGLPEDRAIRDMNAAFHYLATRADVDSKHIGSIGWSMGGGFAIQLAIHEPRLAACVVNYGVLPADPVEVKRINAQVLVNCGARDRGILPSRVRAFEQLMKAAGQSADVKSTPELAMLLKTPAIRVAIDQKQLRTRGAALCLFLPKP